MQSKYYSFRCSLNLKLKHEVDTYIKLISGIDGDSFVVRLTNEPSVSTMSDNVDEAPDVNAIGKGNIADKKEDIIKIQRNPNGVVDLNDIERITSTQNVYYSL